MTKQAENDFDKWNDQKKTVENSKSKIKFEAGQFWWASVGKNVGREIDGKNHNFERSVLIIKKYNSEQFLGLPTTSKISNNKFYSTYRYFTKGKEEIIRSISLSQPRIYSSKRLIRRAPGKVTSSYLKEIVEKMLTLIKSDLPQ